MLLRVLSLNLARAARLASLIIIVALACQPAGPPSDAPNDGEATDEDIANAPNLDEWAAAVARRPPTAVTARPTYSCDLIERAYRAGEITEEECYRWLLTAVYDHDHLPEPFRAQQPPYETTSLMRRIAARYDSLGPQTQELLRPFMLSFDDPESFWYDPNEPTASDLIPTFKPRGAYRAMERPGPGGTYFLITGATEERRDLVSEALNLAYDKFADAGFEEPTDWIRVRLRPNLTEFDGEETWRMLLGQARCHLLIRSDLPDDELRATAAHELFHCFQEYVEATPEVFMAEWVWESSAAWSEEFVYPEANTEHGYDDSLFPYLNEYFFDTLEEHEYGSYLYWFFLYQEHGKTAAVVRDLYGAIQRDGTLEALTGQPDFYAQFKRYALWNLNTPPHKFYEDAGGAPNLRPSGDSVRHTRLRAWDTISEPVDIFQGGMMYYVYTFDDEIDKVVFDVHQLKKQDSNQNGIQMLYRVQGRWNYRDVSYLDDVKFCRSWDSEEVDSVVFIVSNGKLDEAMPDSVINTMMEVDSTGTCADVWHGYVECTWNSSGAGDGRGDDYFVLGNFTSQGMVRVDEVLLYDGQHDVFLATEQTVSTTSHYQWFFQPVPPSVDTSYIAWEQRVEDKNATRTYTHEPGPDCPPYNCFGMPRRIRAQEDGDGTYLLDDQYFANVGPYVSVYSAYHIPGSLGIMQGHVAEVRTSEDEHMMVVTCPREAFPLTMSDDGLRLSGTYTSETISCQAEYSFN